ncbi:hypothetical protein BLNAU_10083 [Blattamonas nauphoetae]|uniref:Uncharacterized protein n=1 Tax=Blattamonas nauphoetae TaxID=2049346 RepID=A0ABQ9XTY9_9EUKA|nr:hypothetical protein BLNAU_10083 [Blattamonas nauphoetae]
MLDIQDALSRDGCDGGKDEEKEGKERCEEADVPESPPARLSTCVRRGRRISESLFVALADDTAKDDRLSPHSSSKTTPTKLEGRTRIPLTNLSGKSTSECATMQTDRQNTDTADLANCHVVSAVAASLAGHT